MNFQADFLDDGEGVDAEGCVYMQPSRLKPFQGHPFRSVQVCLPPLSLWFGDSRLGNSAQGMGYFACFTAAYAADLY